MHIQHGDKLNILIVESDPVAIHFFRKSLEEDSSYAYSVDHASSIEDALEKLRDNSYHILLVEEELNEETGLELLEAMQSLQLNMPCIMMTAMPDGENQKEALDLGVSRFINKNENQFQDLANLIQDSYREYVPKDRRKEPQKIKPKEKAKKKVVRKAEVPPPSTEKPSLEKRRRQGVQDDLTGLYSHSHLYDRVSIEFNRVARYGYPLSCLIIDLDHFKRLNEEYGYYVGDEVLKQSAELLFESCRLSDIVARFGGEEFAILLPHTDYEGAAEVAKRLQQKFSKHIFKINSKEIRVTVSIGVSAAPEDNIEQPAEITSLANEALLRSKVCGRNTVTLYKEIVPTFGEDLPDMLISEQKIQDFQRKMTEISTVARKAYLDASKALIAALENKDRFTAGHAASCAKYCLQTAEAMGLSKDEAEIVQHAALLHDIGKICIPDNILLKPGRLTFAEFEEMKQHPYMGYKMLKPIKFLHQEAVMVLHHHEWWNGEGYPCRLRGNEIPLGARIISVIDSYDTMRIAGGRYKKTNTVESTVAELIACAGSQFDPNVVKAFISVLIKRGEISSEASVDMIGLERAIELANEA